MRKMLIVVALLAGCASQPNSYEEEWGAYQRYLRSEIAAGRMSREKAEYLATAKRNELLARKNADDQASMGAAAAGLGLMQSSGPYYNTPSVTCSTMGATTTCR